LKINLVKFHVQYHLMNKYINQFYKMLFSKIDLNQEQILVIHLMIQYHELLIHYKDLKS